jgi:hypothetical protein
MFAGLLGFETSLRPSLRAKRAAERGLDRRKIARAVERVIREEGRPTVGRGPRYLIQPAVLWATSADLRAIYAVLADLERPVPASAVADVRSLLRDGATSPLYGRDPEAAAAAVAALRARIEPTAPTKVADAVMATATR